MAPPPPPLLPELMDELVEEILLRLPLDSPAHLVGAALVCRRWRRHVSGAGFRRRLRAFHRSPPMLGFLCNTLCNNQNSYITHHTHFVPTMTSSCSPHAGDHPGGWRADDARHGRVLLSRRGASGLELMVWDPTTDHLQELPALSWPTYSWKAAVLCASAACDHLDCHLGGPFRVVYIGVGDDGAFSCIYSSDAAVWSKPVSIELRRFSYTKSVQSVLVGKALYFMFHENNEVLEYDLELCQVVSVIKLPPYTNWRCVVLTTTEDGGLGFATAIEHRLYLWSRKDGSKGDADGWIQSRVINLEGLLRISDVTLFAHVVGYADGADVIFFRMGDVFFTIDIKTCKVNEVYKGTHIYGIVPHMGFCTPAPGGTGAGEGPNGKRRCLMYMKEEKRYPRESFLVKGKLSKGNYCDDMEFERLGQKESIFSLFDC